MQPVIQHSWNISETEALRLQTELAAKVSLDDQLGEIALIAGVDVAYAKETDKIVAAVVILDAQTLEVVETSITEGKARFPYIPGLFSFRELPPLLSAFSQLQHTPDLIVCDGQGYAHPRRFGLACHLGIILDIPTIGCGKTRLLGQYQEPEKERGATAPLIDVGEVIGQVLRTQTDVKPIFVSSGHRISLATACEWILRLSPQYRLPETTRKADQLVNSLLKCTSASLSS
ncbi:deoxyribonuclease V [Pseudoalteromonas piscicida]|uniref:deoxyribonuclease V n=1 Tax=Pseudoalteromonas piscicida TaxID=43662 RepID=UPI001EFD135D|nr:deoxyribonuclease V [Pseudoalteromonas piscicida]MCG9768451.1 deoxyribonuclease V [Pseudoalteromonas piscicida]